MNGGCVKGRCVKGRFVKGKCVKGMCVNDGGRLWGQLLSVRLPIQGCGLRIIASVFKTTGIVLAMQLSVQFIDVQSNGLQLFRKNRFKSLQNPQISLTNRRIYIIIC